MKLYYLCGNKTYRLTMENKKYQLQNYNRYSASYSESSFWKKLQNVARKAGVKTTYISLLLYYVMIDPRTNVHDKTKIVGAVGYFILPFDMVPDFLPGIGYADDIVALMWAFHAVSSNITPEIKEKAKNTLCRWFGTLDEEDLGSIFRS